jgi:effector-binding domain-containing protein
MRRFASFDERQIATASWLLWIAVFLGALALALVLVTSAAGGTQFDSAEGNFGDGTQPVAAGDLNAVLNKAERALGGDAMLADIEAVRIRSHGMWEMPARQIPPTPFQVELLFQRPDHVRLVWKFPKEMGGEFLFGYDGQDAWSLFGGPPARCKGWHRDVVLQLAAEPQLYLVAPARAKHGDAFALDVNSTAQNPDLVKMVYRPFADGKPWNVWFAKDTGDLLILEHESYQMDGQSALFRSTRSDPKNFAGLNYPSRAKFESVRDGKVVEAGDETIDSIELNPELPTDFFACPAWEVDPTTIGVKDIAQETVVKFVHRGPYSEFATTIESAMDAIMASGLVPLEAVSATYLSDPKSVAAQDIRAELAVRVGKVKEGDPVLPSGYVFTTQPAMRVAYAYHRGDYNQEDEAHERVRTWMAQQGLQPIGPPRAIWYHDPEVTVTEDLFTEVQIPITSSR